MAAHLQKQVDKQKKEAEKKFSSWFMSKFTKKSKTQYIREQDEHTAQSERLRRQKTSSSSSTGSSSRSSGASKRDVVHSPSGTLQRQQSFLRAQLLEMKRHSQEVLLHAKSRGDNDNNNSEDEEYDEVHSVLGDDIDGDGDARALTKQTSRTRIRRSTTSESDHSDGGNQTDDDDNEEKKGGGGGDTDDEENNSYHGGGSLRSSFNGGGSGSQRNSFTGGSGSGRNSVSDELDRRSSRATLLYEEAIHALEEVLHPETAPTRVRRSDSATKRLFARPESEWI